MGGHEVRFSACPVAARCGRVDRAIPGRRVTRAASGGDDGGDHGGRHQHALTAMTPRSAALAARERLACACRRRTARSPRRRTAPPAMKNGAFEGSLGLLGGDLEQRQQHRRGSLPDDLPFAARTRRSRGAAFVAALGRLDLAVVVAAEVRDGRRAARPARSSVMNDSWAIGRPGAEHDRDRVRFVELERQRALPARVAEAGRRVDDRARGARASSCPRCARRRRRAARPTPGCARGRTRPGG